MSDTNTIGAVLKFYREEAGYSQRDFEETLKISKSQIEALEADDFQKLPADLYVVNFIKAYAKVLKLNDQKLIDLYKEQKQSVYKEPTKSSEKKVKSIITPRKLKRGVVALCLAVFITYIIFQVVYIFKEPDLIIISPESNNIIINETYIDVEGVAEKESTIYINDKEIDVDKKGRFTSTLDLQKGLNIIKISAHKKYARPAVIYQQVLVE